MNALTPTTREALIQRFNACHESFRSAAAASEPLMVEQVNKAAEMGVLLKELLGCESVTRARLVDWLAKNPGRLTEENSEWLMNYISVSNKTGQVKKFSDAPRIVVQLAFQCAGLLPPETGRETEQISHIQPPSIASWKIRSDLEKHFGSLFKTLDRWDDIQRDSVRTEIEKAKTYLEELEGKL